MDPWIYGKGDSLSFPDAIPISTEIHLDDSCSRSQSQVYLDDYFRFSTSSDDDNSDVPHYVPSANSFESTSKRLDYMLQFLDRKLSADYQNQGVGCDHHSHPPPSLPEFVAKGGGNGIYRVPVRAAVHPSRPPSLELRPHPLRESQIKRFLRVIVATESQLWAGSECGVRFWKFTDLYASSYGVEGDHESAPFMESTWTSPTICLVADEGHRLVWSGHKDGKIRCWKMDYSLDESTGSHFKDVLSWQAHRGPVLSLLMSSYGDLWSGSECGTIKIWPWEAVEKSISSREEERHLAVLLVERSYVDLRSQLTANGFSNFLNSDVKYLLSDNSQGKVWSAGYFQFALWNAHTRELLKVFNSDGQVENRMDMSSVQDLSMELVSGLRKEKMQSSIGFFQRSRNAIIGAADAVRRVAAKGVFGDDNRRNEALAITIDGMIWTGSTSGLLVQWDGNGNRVRDIQHHASSVQCFCSFGSRIWVGYVTGIIQVLDLDGNLLGAWVAHSSPILKITVGSGYIFTLAAHGGIRGWNITSPGPVDQLLRSEVGSKEFLYTRIENLRMLTGTWNVGQGKASHDSLISWLGCMASDVSIVVVGLQEVEMGAGFLAMSAAKETVGLEGSSVGQWWLDVVGKILDEGSSFDRVGSRQLAGLLIAVWVRNNIRSHVGDVDAAAVPCGFGRAIGNKGAVGLRLRVYDRVFCFVNCHFAAHLDAVNRRNADFEHVYRTMTFCRPMNPMNAAAAGTSSTVQMLRCTNVIADQNVEGMPELSEADMLVFLGDFNYRLDGITYDEARDFVSQRCFDWLRERDQLRAEMEAGNVFQGMREATITFPPTYKFERHQAGLAGIDSGEKKRVPAWCDRILYRDNRTLQNECGLECPVVSSVVQYEACMDVTDSDHKPVRCIFSVDIARVDESILRQEFGEILRSNEKIKHLLNELCKIPETIISTNNIILQTEDTSILRMTNKCTKDNALFQILCEGQCTLREDGTDSDFQTIGSFGFPRWLKVTPTSGIIGPEHILEVLVNHEEYHTLEEFVDGIAQNCWCEYCKDKEVLLTIKIAGSYSSKTRNHQVRVRHCFPARAKQKDAQQDRMKGSVLHRSDIQRLSSNDLVDRLKKFSES